MKKKITSFIIAISLLSSPMNAEEETCEKPSQACVEGKKTTAAIAWTAFGISLLIAVGVIVSISINNNHSSHCKDCR